MKTKGIILCLCFACAAFSAGPTDSGSAPGMKPADIRGSIPLYFIANAGQMDARALFQAQARGYILWLTREGLVFDHVKYGRKGEPSRSVTRLDFKNANKDFEVIASDPADYRVSYFFGSDESEWKTDIPTAKNVLYKNLYDGIDLKVYGADRQIEYDWIVAPGGRPDRIGWAYTGADKIGLDREGNLVVENPFGRFIHRKPSAYQLIGGRRVSVETSFREMGNGAYGFTVRAYDPRHELTIDPLVLVYSSYLGGRGDDVPHNIAVDSTGAVYLCGRTRSRDFPPVTQTLPRDDIFVTKMSSDGSSLIYSAFFPGWAFSDFLAMGIFVDVKGFVYLAGGTTSSKFPVKNAFQTQYGRGTADGYILKLARSGKSLVYSSYIGGMDWDECSAIGVDASGAAYLGGITSSANFPTKKAFQKKFGGRADAFIAKVAPQGSSLVYSTYLGPSGDDACAGLAVDAEGAVTIAGVTSSTNFPVKSAFQKAHGGGGSDAFITRLSPAGDSLVYSSYLGGSSVDWALDMAMDETGAAYVIGETRGNFPLKNAYQSTRGGGCDAFITKIEPQGKAVVYSSYLGGKGDDLPWGIAVDKIGTVYIVGQTESYNFPLKSPLQGVLRGGQDCFLTVVDPGGLKLKFSTYLGGFYEDCAAGIVLDANGAVYLDGNTNSPDFPVLKPYQKALKGEYDAFVLKLSQKKTGRSKP